MTSRWGLVAACGLAVCSACTRAAPAPTMAAPAGFVGFERSADRKWITADGVRLKVRRVANEPRGDLAFWMDALARHLDQRGYRRLPDALEKIDAPPPAEPQAPGDVTEVQVPKPRCFDAAGGLRGCQGTWLVPRRGEDWVMTVAVFVDGDHIHLVEGTGAWKAWRPHHRAISAALATFELPRK